MDTSPSDYLDHLLDDVLPPPPLVADSASVEQPAEPSPNGDNAPPWRPTVKPLPYWCPRGVDLKAFPPEIVDAIADVIDPVYSELVLCAPPGIARSTGLTVVHLLWQEIIDHFQLARRIPAWDPLAHELCVGESREKLIDRHLRIVNSKLKASELLNRLDEFKTRRRDRRGEHSQWCA